MKQGSSAMVVFVLSAVMVALAVGIGFALQFRSQDPGLLLGSALFVALVFGGSMVVIVRIQEGVMSKALWQHKKRGDLSTKVVSSIQVAVKKIEAASAASQGSMDKLTLRADESASSVLEMTATSEEVAENVSDLANHVRETASSIEEMTYSVREVARNVDALARTAEETASSMNQIDVSIDHVQSNAKRTEKLSEEVATDAESGAEAIVRILGEIRRIKESSSRAVTVISSLGSRIEAIGDILNVIDEVAEQTNLLALNAAIIAAQAGEHGKGFAVVADEIKELAERTGASTKEIADLIKTIQAASKDAISAVETGAEIVDRGVEVSAEADQALKKILRSSKQSTLMVGAIAQATVEQSKGSKQVTDAIGRIAMTVQQIAAATAQQAKGAELIMKTPEKMRLISHQVEKSSQEQLRGGRQMSELVANISEMAKEIRSSQKSLNEYTDKALASVQVWSDQYEEGSESS